MIKNLRLLLLAAVLAAACTSPVPLTFQAGEDGSWSVPGEQLDAWARTILQSDDIHAAQLLDQGYRQADSLSADDPQARTLERFALDVAERFMNLKSPFYDDHAYEMALDREQECVHWTSWGRRGMDWRRSILNLNRPGTRVCDFWLSKGGEAPDTLLRQLLPGAPLTVLFLYGESCPSCERLMEEIGANRRFPRLAEQGKAQFISLYTGEDRAEFAALRQRLPAYWDNWMDRESVVKYNRAFDTRRIPSLYIIDNKEIVLQRGLESARNVERFLKSP